ncbi:MAG: hypothetical protein WAK50_12245, partial [Nitrososphaeraceae archaeon]
GTFKIVPVSSSTLTLQPAATSTKEAHILFIRTDRHHRQQWLTLYGVAMDLSWPSSVSKILVSGDKVIHHFHKRWLVMLLGSFHSVFSYLNPQSFDFIYLKT